MKLKCIRTNSSSGVETHEEHRAVLRHSQGSGWCLYLEPGVTGYESFLIRDWYYGKNNHTKDGWCACAGTANSWDKLVVPPEEMERLRDILELLPI